MAVNKKMVCHDTQACIKCFACIVNCGLENRIRLQRDKNIDMVDTLNDTDIGYLNYLKIKTSESGEFPNAKKIIAFNHCRHCDKPFCAKVCPTNALVKQENGIVTLDRDVCVGCEMCVTVCPFHVPEYYPEAGKTYKCFMCTDRLEAGLKTACSEACPSVAIFSGDADEVMAEAQKRAKKYTEVTGIEYFVYGDGNENLPVGTLGYISVAPKQDREAYDLPADPSSGYMAARQALRAGTAIIAGATAAGIIGHVANWNKNKKTAEVNEKEGK